MKSDVSPQTHRREEKKEAIQQRIDSEKDVTTREQQILDNQGLVWHVVKRFTGRGLEREELFQIGCIGLIKAVDRFDSKFQVQFSTYAVPMIIGEIKRYFREDGIVKVSRSIKENRIKINIASMTFQVEHSREPSLEELAEETGLKASDIVLALDSAREVEAIGEWEHTVEPESEHVINRLFVEEMLGQLEEKERNVIKLRYFEEWKQKKIAKELGMTQVQVSRMEKRALNQLHKKMLAESQ